MRKRTWFIALLLVIMTLFAITVSAESPDSALLIDEDPMDDPEANDQEIGGTEVLPMDDLDFLEEGTIEEEIIEARVMRFGDEGEDVLELQTRLTEMNYYTGNLSGKFREGTRSALKSFQDDFGLEATGVADMETQYLLYSSVYRPLRFGSNGEDVKQLQLRLTELGYYTGKISGNFLEGTRSAVRKAQELNGLTVTGEADPETQTVFFSGKVIGKNDMKRPTATPEPGQNGYLVDEQAAQEVVATPSGYIRFEASLSKGTKGDDVKKLQSRLTELGYYSGPVSGNFLGKTATAVKQLQKQNGLKEDGTVNEEVWNLIFNDETVVLPQHTAKPTPEPTPVPFRAIVDVTNQVTTVYARDDAGEYTVVVREMLCSTGTKANPSDPGDWVLNGRKAKWCYFPKWGSHARYWTRINSSIAFHSVIYNSVNTMDLSVSSYKALGNRASHGCIRLSVADAKWVYDNLGEGTVVSIIENLPVQQELRESLKKPELNKKTMLPYETPEPTAAPNYISGAEPPRPFRKMTRKDSGADVYWMQCKLKELGYYSGKCSGTYLDGTRDAVKAFQKANGLAVNGVADVGTLERMYSVELAIAENDSDDSALNNADAPEETSETPSPTGIPSETPAITPAETPVPTPTEVPAWLVVDDEDE